MTESSLEALIKSTCKIPVFRGAESIIYPAATLEITGYPVALAGDGKCKLRESEAVIDLWFENKSDRDTNEALLLAAIEAKDGTSIPDVASFYDTTAKKYRSVFSFNFIPRQEET